MAMIFTGSAPAWSLASCAGEIAPRKRSPLSEERRLEGFLREAKGTVDVPDLSEITEGAREPAQVRRVAVLVTPGRAHIIDVE